MADSAYNIDFTKVDRAFQQLAESDDGEKALSGLSSALESVESAAGGDLNKQEAHYLLTNLVQQRPGRFSPGLLDERAGKSVAGFVIKTAVP